jgi:hypothetical protein
MKKIRFAALGLLLALGLVTTASAVTVNGVLGPGEWDGLLIDDATNDDHGAGDMRRWGWQVDHDAAGGPMLYVAFEMWDTIQTGPSAGSPHPTLDQYENTGGGWPPTPASMFPGIWFNVDPRAAVPTGTDAGDCDFNRADLTRTCDVNLEMGSDFGVIVNPPANPSTGTRNPDSLNFWGTDGSVGEDFGKYWNCSDGVFYYSGHVIEIGVRLSLVATAANLASGAVADPVTWRIGTRFAGNGHTEVGPDWVGDLNGARQDEGTVWISVARPGDTDGDGDIDLNDLNRFSDGWYGNLPPSWATGDFDGDNDVDLQDLNLFSDGWYGPAGPGGEGAVPEPGALCLLVLGVLTLAVRGRLKR